jgi:hypothetical protein
MIKRLIFTATDISGITTNEEATDHRFDLASKAKKALTNNTFPD